MDWTNNSIYIAATLIPEILKNFPGPVRVGKKKSGSGRVAGTRQGLTITTTQTSSNPFEHFDLLLLLFFSYGWDFSGVCLSVNFSPLCVCPFLVFPVCVCSLIFSPVCVCSFFFLLRVSYKPESSVCLVWAACTNFYHCNQFSFHFSRLGLRFVV